jgi:secreted trypsin-like serine protease
MQSVMFILVGVRLATAQPPQTGDEFRIVNGASADIKTLPYMVQLIPLPRGNPICGGSILSDLWVLTAAHCFS